LGNCTSSGFFVFTNSCYFCVENRENPAKVGSVRRVVYKDGTVQLIKLSELNDATYTLTWDVIMSEPAVTYSSAVHTIRLRRVTVSKQTVVELVSDYSSDASLEVIQDSKYKKLEFVRALRDAMSPQDRKAQGSQGNRAALEEFNRRAEEAERLISLLTQRLDSIERARRGGGQLERKGGDEGIILQATGYVKDGKGPAWVAHQKKFTERARNEFTGILSHTGATLLDDKRYITNVVFRDSESLANYVQSSFSHDRATYDQYLEANSLRLVIFGAPSAQAKQILAQYKPTYYDNNGFTR